MKKKFQKVSRIYLVPLEQFLTFVQLMKYLFIFIIVNERCYLARKLNPICRDVAEFLKSSITKYAKIFIIGCPALQHVGKLVAEGLHAKDISLSCNDMDTEQKLCPLAKFCHTSGFVSGAPGMVAITAFIERDVHYHNTIPQKDISSITQQPMGHSTAQTTLLWCISAAYPPDTQAPMQ